MRSAGCIVAPLAAAWSFTGVIDVEGESRCSMRTFACETHIVLCGSTLSQALQTGHQYALGKSGSKALAYNMIVLVIRLYLQQIFRPSFTTLSFHLLNKRSKFRTPIVFPDSRQAR